MGQVNILRNNFFQTKVDQYACVYIPGESKLFFFFPFRIFVKGGVHAEIFILSFPERNKMF